MNDRRSRWGRFTALRGDEGVALTKVLVTVVAGMTVAVAVVALVLIDRFDPDRESDEASPPSTATSTPGTAGDRPNPFGPTTTTTPARTTSSENEPAPGGDTEDRSPLVPDCSYDLAVGEVVELYTTAEVTLGTGGFYYITHPYAEGKCNEYALSEALRRSSTLATEVPVRAASGGCSFLDSLPVRILAELGFEVPSTPAAFVANITVSPTEYVGLTESAENGVINGGFSKGGDGSRGSGEYWQIDDASGTTSYEGGVIAYDPSTAGVVAIVMMEATWDGQSIENWTREEGLGYVKFSCVNAVGIEPFGLEGPQIP